MNYRPVIISTYLFLLGPGLLEAKQKQRVILDSEYTYRILDGTTEINQKQIILLKMREAGLLQNFQMYIGADMNVVADLQATNAEAKFGYLMRHPTQNNQGGMLVSELVIHAAQFHVTGTITPWATMYSQLLYNPAQSFGPGTMTDLERNQLSLRRGYILFGDMTKFPIYASIGKMAIPFGLTDTVSPFSASTVWHAFGGLAFGGLVGYHKGGLTLSVMGIQGGAQFRAANSGDETPDDVSNFSINGSYDFKVNDSTLLRLGGGYLDGSAYCQPFPVVHFQNCDGVKNPAWGVHGVFNFRRFTFMAEFARTTEVWPGTHNPNPPLDVFEADTVSAFDLGAKYSATIQSIKKTLEVSIEFSQFDSGPSGSPWENQSQFVLGLQMFWAKNLKGFAEYIRTDGYVPLNFISGPDPFHPRKLPGTTHSSSDTKSNVFLLGFRMAI